MPSSVRLVSISLLFLSLLSPGVAENAAPAASTSKSAVADLESKLSIALRSYSLLDAKLDQLKASHAQLAAEKAALEARLTEAQAAVPLAAQAVTLRDQLRQTQAQMAAYAEENVQLKSKLALGSPDASRPARSPIVPTAMPAPTAAGTPTPAANPQRMHIVVEGDTLVKISQTYYGTTSRWNEILAANREVLRDEKSLVIGRSLIVP